MSSFPVVAWKRSWTWTVLIVFHLVFTETFYIDFRTWCIKTGCSSLKRIICLFILITNTYTFHSSQKFLLNISWKWHHQLIFAFAFQVNNSKVQNILLIQIFGNSSCLGQIRKFSSGKFCYFAKYMSSMGIWHSVWNYYTTFLRGMFFNTT